MNNKEDIEINNNIEEINENIEKTNIKESSTENISTKKESKFFKKKDDKFQKQIELLEENNEILKDKYLRLVAEYENYRKRTAKERIELSNNVKANLLLDFLPIIDDMDRALLHLKENDNGDFTNNLKGIQLIADKFYKFLGNYGVAEIDAKGKEFDIDLHDAISRFPVQNEDEKGKIIEVVQKGYKMNDKVIRFAKVVVGE